MTVFANVKNNPSEKHDVIANKGIVPSTHPNVIVLEKKIQIGRSFDDNLTSNRLPPLSPMFFYQ